MGDGEFGHSTTSSMTDRIRVVHVWHNNRTQIRNMGSLIPAKNPPSEVKLAEGGQSPLQASRIV